jgi:predicted Zn-dependent protease
MNQRLRTGSTRVSVFLLAFALAACITPGAQKEAGDEEAKKVEQQMGVLRDHDLNAYVVALGTKLAAVSELPQGPWQFKIIDRPEPNAFALPGGHIYVTRGLLTLVNSEDELAGVIGHEIGHVTADHSAKRMAAAIVTAPVNIATGIAGGVLGIVSPTLGSVVAGTGTLLTGGLVLAPYSREQEHDADEIGQNLAARAGYDPAGLPRFLNTLDRDVALLSKEERNFHFLDSHPLTPDRVARTEERAKTLAQAASSPIASGRDAVFAKLEGILVGEDPAQGVFVKSRFLHPEFDLAMTFPAEWETRNTNEAAGAVSPKKDGLVALRMASENETLKEVLDESAKDQPSQKFERFEVNGLPAARTRFEGNDAVAEVTLIEYDKYVYAIVGEAADSVAKKYIPLFRATVSSFHPLKDSERRAISESRLRVRKAKAGETPEQIAKRTDSTWDAAHVAVANGVEVGDRFDAGRSVKLALPQLYKAKPKTAE